MDKEYLEQLKEKYKLTPEQEQERAETIFDKITFEKDPSGRPFAVIVIGQPGAGKSNVMTYTGNELPTAVKIDIDDFRKYHPNFFELRQLPAEAYEAITGAFASRMIHLLTPALIERKHDLIFHKTRGDNAVVEDTIIPLKENGYDVIMRVLAVHELESKMSALERSQEQLETLGYCRWVDSPYHTKHYHLIPELAQFVEDSGLVDAVDVYTRGEIPIYPELHYSKVLDSKIYTNPHLIDDYGNPIIGNYDVDKYKSTMDAIVKIREATLPRVLETIDDKINAAEGRAVSAPGGRDLEFLNEIKDIYSRIQMQ